MKVCYLLPPSSTVFVCRYIYRLYLEQVTYPEAKQRITKPPLTEHWLPTYEQVLHRPTDHRPSTYRQVFNRPTDPPTHRQVLHRPTDRRPPTPEPPTDPPLSQRPPTSDTWTTDPPTHRLNKTHKIFQNRFSPYICNYYILRLPLTTCQWFFVTNLLFGILHCLMHVILSLFQRVDLKTISSLNFN